MMQDSGYRMDKYKTASFHNGHSYDAVADVFTGTAVVMVSTASASMTGSEESKGEAVVAVVATFAPYILHPSPFESIFKTSTNVPKYEPVPARMYLLSAVMPRDAELLMGSSTHLCLKEVGKVDLLPNV